MKSPLQAVMQGTNQASHTSITENELHSHKPKILVAGIGGGGNNTVDRLSAKGIPEVEMVAINTDQTHLKHVKTNKKIAIGQEITQGRGTGGFPEIGERATENAEEELRDLFKGQDLVFLACGLGGGTGTGGAPILAKIAKEEGAVVTGVVTMPFKVEKKTETAENGLEKLRKYADSVIVIDNNRLSDMASGLPMRYAFTMADEVLSQMVKGIAETIMAPSLINLDFADVRAIMEEGSIMLVGTGEAKGENRAEKSVLQALECPLLGDIDYSTAKGVIMHVSGSNVSIAEANRIGEIVQEYVNPNTQNILGARINRNLGETLQTILLISGASSPHLLGPASDKGVNSSRGSSSKRAEAPINLNIGYL